MAVDPQSLNRILEGIQELNRQGSTIIYTSHYMEEVEQICTRIGILDHGRCIASGTKEELKNMIKTGERVTVEELLYGLLLCSGNDAAEALADGCGGTASFVRRMNSLAGELGMEDTSFENPSGLDGQAHYSTARDMARLACAAVENETLVRMASTRSVTIGGRTMTNHNKLLSRLDGCVGLKTGYTKAAGRTLVSCAEQAGHRLVAVTLRDGDDWNDHEALYRWGFLLTGIQETLETRLLGALGNGGEVTP